MESNYIGYAWEQLYGAVSSLATTDLPLRGRLLNAVVSRASRVFSQSSQEGKLPLEISARLRQLEKTLTRNGSFEDTIEIMEDQEVYNTIEEIVNLFNKVARAYPEVE